MRHQTTRHHAVRVRRSLALAALVAFVGCAASVGAAVAATTSHASSSSRSGTSRSATGVAIDRRIARAAQLRQSDFPAGWTSTPATGSAAVPSCPGMNGAKAALSAQANSRDFMLGATVTAASVAYLYADSATAAHWFAQLTSRHTTGCIVRELRQGLGFQAAAQGATLDSITSHRLVIEPVGDQQAAHLLTIRISANGRHATAYADVIFVRVGRAIAGFDLASVGQIFDTTLENKLATVVAGRLASGLRPGRVIRPSAGRRPGSAR